MAELGSNSINQQPSSPPPSAGGETVTPAGQKKVALFGDGKFVESGRMLPWFVLAAVIGALTWVVMDAWSLTWQEVSIVDQHPTRMARRYDATLITDQETVDRFYPERLAKESQDDFSQGGPSPFRDSAFALVDLDNAGTANYLVAAYTNGFSGAIRVLKREANGQVIMVNEPSFSDLGGSLPGGSSHRSRQ